MSTHFERGVVMSIPFVALRGRIRSIVIVSGVWFCLLCFVCERSNDFTLSEVVCRQQRQ